jgi:hypothetical protein
VWWSRAREREEERSDQNPNQISEEIGAGWRQGVVFGSSSSSGGRAAFKRIAGRSSPLLDGLIGGWWPGPAGVVLRDGTPTRSWVVETLLSLFSLA